jgi:hypothetical protein
VGWFIVEHLRFNIVHQQATDLVLDCQHELCIPSYGLIFRQSIYSNECSVVFILIELVMAFTGTQTIVYVGVDVVKTYVTIISTSFATGMNDSFLTINIPPVAYSNSPQFGLPPLRSRKLLLSTIQLVQLPPQ